VSDFLEAGTRLVWVVDPLKRSARVYRADGGVDEVDADGRLSGEDVIPGLTIPLSEMVD
jgi:Uma2 family endonuclease